MLSRLTAAALSVLMLGGTFAGATSYNKFVEKKQAEKEEKIGYYREIAKRESDWILSLQQDNGAVLMYKPSKEESGHLNPYFACEAMLGVISDGDPAHVEAAGRYLKWHTKALIKEDGFISDYKMENGKLKSQQDGDSFDSYAAYYLLLFTEYVEKGGDLKAIGDYRKAIVLLASGFDEVLLHGVTYVRNNYRIAYLMDNTEVWEGLKRAGTLLTTDPQFAKEYRLLSAGEKFLDIADSVKNAIEERYWLKEEDVYTIGLKKSGEVFGTPDFNEFYPDAVAQLYPAIMHVRTVGGREKRLYEQVCRYHDWEHDNIEGATFHWTVMAYAAAVHADQERLDTYLEVYDTIVSESRSYPLHTATAGWIARACNLMADSIDNEKDTGFFKYIEWLIGVPQ